MGKEEVDRIVYAVVSSFEQVGGVLYGTLTCYSHKGLNDIAFVETC